MLARTLTGELFILLLGELVIKKEMKGKREMAQIDTSKLLAGNWELAIGSTLIPAELLGEISPNYEEGTMEAETQAGKRSQPSGKADTAELTFTVYLPSLDYVKQIFNVADAKPMVFGGGACVTQKAVPINIHPICNGKDGKDDIHIFAGLIKTVFNPTLSTGDSVSVEFTVMMQPTSDGYMLLGYPDGKTPQYWDIASQSWKNTTTASS